MPFSKIIGQESIKNRLMVSVNAMPETKLAQPIFFGEAGLGKTEIGKAYAHAMAEKLETEILFFNSPEEFRHAESAEYQTFLNWLASDTGVLVIDECHKFGDKATVQMQKVQSFLLKALDGQNEGKLIQFDQDNSFIYDKSRKVIVMMTNYSHKVNPALASRMDVCNLQPYTANELQAICVQMMAQRDMVAECEKTLSLLAKASRGTARPLYNMIEHMARMGCQTINREIAVQVMRDLDMYPCGLVKGEIHLLEYAKQGTTKQVARMAVQEIQDNLSNSIAYLMAHNLLQIHGALIKTSEKGQKFLNSLRAVGFIQ
jgi:replication-associated recombination protein RarA